MNDHATHPELWFRPSPNLSLEELIRLIGAGARRAPPRLGLRDASHEKGYAPGQIATLRVCAGRCEEGAEKLAREARITSVTAAPLRALRGMDMKANLCYGGGWSAIRDDLSFFEGRPVGDDDVVSIIAFEYLQKGTRP